MESMCRTRNSETGVIKRIPCDWQELFVLLNDPRDAQVKAQVWYDQMFGSQYGCTPKWSDVLESLTALEPYVTDNGNLDFQLRFTAFPISTQKNFLVFLMHHVDSFPTCHVQAFLEKLPVVKDDDLWLQFLREKLKSQVTYSLRLKTLKLEDNSSVNEKLRFGTSQYSFSTEENRNVFQDLCKEIRASSETLPWQQSYNFLKKLPEIEPMEARTTSPVLFTSPVLIEAVSAVEQPNPKSAVDSSQSQGRETLQSTQHIDGPAFKRLKVEASQSFSESFQGTAADFSFSQISVPITSDEWGKVARLKDVWRTCSADTPVPEDINLFLTCTASQMKEVCAELELDTLSEVSMTVCCDHVCGLGDQLSHGNCVEFLMAVLLPKVKTVTMTFSRSLCNVLIKLSEQFPRQVIDGVITACLQDQEAAICQAQMFCKVTKDVFTAANRVYLLQKLLDDDVPVSAGLLLLIHLLMDLKVEMDTTLIQSLLHTLRNFSGFFAEDIKFGKLLLALVTKYGKQMDGSNIERLKGIASENRSFLKKAVLAAITKLEKTT